MVELSKEGNAPAKVVVVDVGGVVCAVMSCDQPKDQVKPAQTGYTCQCPYHSKHIRDARMQEAVVAQAMMPMPAMQLRWTSSSSRLW